MAATAALTLKWPDRLIKRSNMLTYNFSAGLRGNIYKNWVECGSEGREIFGSVVVRRRNLGYWIQPLFLAALE